MTNLPVHDFMNTLYQILKPLSAILFLYYGAAVLFSNAMVTEFEQFGLPNFRKLTGILELLGAAGLIAGYFIPPLVVVASGGLALLMVLGLAVRFRSRSTLPDSLAALAMLLINLFICTYALGLFS
ncbi:MAG: DoxX family protein [Mycobacterium sp.]|nr:DoxX family protein [Mycobacterium sp.]